MICALCNTEHGPHQAHRFASDTRPVFRPVVNKRPDVVVNRPTVVNKPKPATVVNRSADRHKDKDRRRDYSRAYMVAWRARRKAGS